MLSHAQLCDPMDCSPPGSSVHGIFQARMLEWVAVQKDQTLIIIDIQDSRLPNISQVNFFSLPVFALTEDSLMKRDINFIPEHQTLLNQCKLSLSRAMIVWTMVANLHGKNILSYNPIHHILLLIIFPTPCGMWGLSTNQESNPHPPVLEAQNLNHWTIQEVPPPCISDLTSLSTFSDMSQAKAIQIGSSELSPTWTLER